MVRGYRKELRGVAVLIFVTVAAFSWQWPDDEAVRLPMHSPEVRAVVTDTSTSPNEAGGHSPLMDVVEPDQATIAAEADAVAGLSLVLRGIFATRDKAYSIALIQHPDGRESHFYRGDDVFGMARLEAIRVDHVVLLHDGHYHRLYLPERSLKVARETELARKRGEVFARLRKDFLSGNIMNLVHLVGADTAYDQRGFVGFRLVALSDEGGRMLEELGLSDGDIVTHIDGQEIAQSLQSVRQTIDKLRDAPLTTVTIVRQGRSLEVPLLMPEEAPVRSAADS